MLNVLLIILISFGLVVLFLATTFITFHAGGACFERGCDGSAWRGRWIMRALRWSLLSVAAATAFLSSFLIFAPKVRDLAEAIWR